MKRALVALVVAVTPTASSSTSPPAVSPAPRVERPVPFHVGETLTYDVSWSTSLTAGTVVATVKEKKPSYNSTAYYIVAEGRPTPLLSKVYWLYYKLDTLLDSGTLLSQRGAIYSEEGRHRRYRTTRFDRAARQAIFEDVSNGLKHSFGVSPSVQDPLSALYVLRTVPLKLGGRVTIPVSDNGTTYQVRMDVGATERVRTPVAEVNAWKIRTLILDSNGQAQGRNIVVWIADDPQRFPMKFQAEFTFGTFNFVLREAQ